MAEYQSSAALAEPARVLVASIGSLGDLHPLLAMGLELQRRGHSVAVASIEFYRSKVEALGLEFRPLRPNWDPTDRELIAQCEDMRTGAEVLVRKLVLPNLRNTCEDLLAAAADADVMVANELLFAAPLVSEKLGIPWASAILSPGSFFSVYDPSLLAAVPEAYWFRNAGPAVNRGILELARLSTHHWWNPVRELRRDLGLRVECEPIFRDKFAPDLVLALFSHMLAEPQPDWPKQTVQPGFIFFDKHGQDSPEIAEFLASGEPPIVFTLGSAAVHNPGDFYEASLAAAQLLGRRALLVGAKDQQGTIAPGMLAVPYARYSQVFSHASVVVHQGGSGTTGQAMRAGCPQLIVPYGWDQPDNGARVERTGAGLVLKRTEYRAETAAAALRSLLEDSRFAVRTAEIMPQIRAEHALAEACDAVESALSKRNRLSFQL